MLEGIEPLSGELGEEIWFSNWGSSFRLVDSVEERAMGGGKSEGNLPGPLFPRLHVNDKDKGGPKPPPRNKMALYEQLSIPPPRLSDIQTAILPLPPIHGGTLANMDSSNKGLGLEKSRFQPYNVRDGSFSTDGTLNETNGSSINRLMVNTHTREINDTEMCTPFQPSDTTSLKWPSRTINESHFKARSLNERCLGGSSSLQSQADVFKRLETSTSANQNIEDNSKIFNDKNVCSLAQDSQENGKNLATIVKGRDNISPTISLKPITSTEHSERSFQVPISSNSHHKCSEVNEIGTSKAWVIGQPGISAMNNADVLRIDPRHNGPHNSTQNDPRQEDENESSPLQASVLNRKEDLTSNGLSLSTVSCAFISPDDVVEMIGHKHFWKVRQAIINQQRVFSMQVFELHRIIKVQRIIASSRHLLTEESLLLHESITKPSSVKEPIHNIVPENPTLLLKLTDIAPNIKLPLDNPFHKNDDFASGIPKTGHKFGKLPMWGLPPPVGNQWLVPVMSPSEGLIYKPYTEPPCPPPGGYLPTVYGSCGSNLPVAPSIGSGPTYFSPYGMPPMGPLVSGSMIENMSNKVAGSKDDDRVICSVYQSSCIVASERNVGEKLENKSFIPKKVPEDVLPLFPTVPTGCGSVPLVASSNGNEKKTKVIKVIPHNPRLASESAARIVKLIQEERKHLCN